MPRNSEETEVDSGKDEAAERQREIQRRREEERRKRQAVSIQNLFAINMFCDSFILQSVFLIICRAVLQTDCSVN